MSSGPDLFQYYIRGVCELLSPVDNFSPSSRLVGAGSGSFRDRDGNEKNRPAGFDGLFCNAVGNELQGHVKTRLMAMLHQCVVSLNREVDEVVDPVLAMHQLRGLLAPAMIHDNNQDVKGEIETESRARKRLKVSNLKGESEYGDCLIQTKKIPYYYKDENGPCFRPSSRNDKENGEVNDDLQILLVNKGSAKKKMEKHSAEYSATLGRMEEKLEELLDMVITTCRPMTLAEKHQLRRLILDLPPQNLDRVAEIIQRRKPLEPHSRSDIPVDLQNQDDLTLWRLYFYVKAVENAQKLL